MKITEVTDKRTQKAFLNVARVIYKDDPNWVCPLNIDIEAVFDPGKNNFHQHGEATRWILTDDNGKLIGRVAAFINEKKAYNYEQPTGGMGFFESINDEKAAFLLFDTAKEWLRANGMKAMDGPINFGENDNFWGLLSEGFTPPSYGMNYNPPYYKKFFDDYGFKTMYEQITNHVEFKHFESSKIEQFAADFIEIYNDGWKDFENFVPITHATIMESFRKMKPLMDENLIWFAYVEGDPAAFVVIFPDANQMFKGINGRLNLIGKLKFVYHRWRGVKRMRAIVMGTKQKYQKHGLESGLFIKLKEYILPLKQYDELELSWVGDFNDKMIALHHAMGGVFGKRHLTMRYIFQ
jgi:hypothetical protein